MKIKYISEPKIFPNGEIRQEEKMEFEFTIEESLHLGERFEKILKTIHDFAEGRKSKKRRRLP